MTVTRRDIVNTFSHDTPIFRFAVLRMIHAGSAYTMTGKMYSPLLNHTTERKPQKRTHVKVSPANNVPFEKGPETRENELWRFSDGQIQIAIRFKSRLNRLRRLDMSARRFDLKSITIRFETDESQIAIQDKTEHHKKLSYR